MFHSFRVSDSFDEAPGISSGIPGFVDPTSLENLIIWVKTDVGVIKDGSDFVSSWADQSAGGNTMTSGGSPDPLWVDAQVNGLPIIRCSSQSQWFGATGTNLVGKSAATLFAAFRVRSTSSTISNAPIFTTRASGRDGLSLTIRIVPGGSNDDEYHSLIRPNPPDTTNSIVSATQTIDGGGSPGPFRMISARWDASGGTNNHQLRVNGSLAAQSTFGAGGVFQGGNFQINVFQSTPGGVSQNVEYGELLAYDVALSDADRQQVENYLINRWGI
jgi:hypothetical protein